MKLNVGSGDKIWPGFVNCDLHAQADINTDCKRLPIADDLVEEIHAIHFVEHMQRLEVENMLMDWHRTMKRGAKLVIEVPCMNKIAQNIVNGERDLRITLMGIFGDPRDDKHGMMHHWCYTKEELSDILEQCGFKEIRVMEPVFHLGRRDMRIEAIKP